MSNPTRFDHALKLAGYIYIYILFFFFGCVFHHPFYFKQWDAMPFYSKYGYTITSFHKDITISIFRMPKVMVLPERNLVHIPQFVISYGILLFSPSLSLGKVNHSHLQCDFSRSSSYTLLQTLRIISHRIVWKITAN